MKKVLVLFTSLLLTFHVFSSGTQEVGETTATPKIVIYNNNGVISGAGGETASSPEILEEMKAWVLSETGIEVEVIAPVVGQESQKLNLLLASGTQVDAFWGNWPDFASRNMILPLNDLMAQYGSSIEAAWPEESFAAMSDTKGNLWGIPRTTPFMGNPLYVRADWAKEFGMDIPGTIDELEDYLAAVKKNKPDSIPLLAEMKGKHGSSGIFQTFAGAFTKYGASNWLDSDGKIKPQELQPGYRDFIIKMNEWYKAGYIYPEFASLNRNIIRDLIKSGKVAANATWYSNVTVPYATTEANNPGIDMEFPEGGLTGPMGKAETINPAGAEGMLISAKCEHPEAVIKVMEFFYSNPANHQVAYMGPENNLWRWTDKSKLQFEILKDRTGYLGDYAFAMGLPMERAVSTDSPQMAKHFGYLGVGTVGSGVTPDGLDYSRGKMPVDAGVVYDPQIIEKEIPGYADIQRMREEEVIKFIMGARPVSEWDAFIDELYSIGLNDWIESYTRMYKSQR
ncbi:MAG: extracellular solute-binding protein [Spirochaetales bacterium]|nr:extracellular solute-binding protein [Spirochaetales bacterium]